MSKKDTSLCWMFAGRGTEGRYAVTHGNVGTDHVDRFENGHIARSYDHSQTSSLTRECIDLLIISTLSGAVT